MFYRGSSFEILCQKLCNVLTRKNSVIAYTVTKLIMGGRIWRKQGLMLQSQSGVRMLSKLLDNVCFNMLILVIVVLILGGFELFEGTKLIQTKPVLPQTVGTWTGPASPRIVTPENIFDYMDGAGELYLGYRFDHIEVYEYKAQNQPDILVELYFMKTSDDAFGLLSLDWGGEAVNLNPATREEKLAHDSSWPQALYGEGLLRLWSDHIYARVMATQETPESRKAVLALGGSITKGRKNPPPPELMGKLPDSFEPDWALRRDRVSYFRSHLVLNSLYYLGHENMLELDLESEGVAAPYEKNDSPGGSVRFQFLYVNYADAGQAKKALAHFHRVYLPEHSFHEKFDKSQKVVNVFPIEDGWLGYRLNQKTLAFVFECPDQETVRTILEQIE
jgi:hypothetical protein